MTLWQFVYLYSPFLPETSVELEECSAFFNSSTASTRPIFQGQFDLPQHHNPSSPFYLAPARCLEPCECCDSVKQISQNRLYGSIFPPAFPRIFKPRCVSSNMAYVPVTSGLETFAFPPQQSADLTVSVKADGDWAKKKNSVAFSFQCLAEILRFNLETALLQKGLSVELVHFTERQDKSVAMRLSFVPQFVAVENSTFFAYWPVWLEYFTKWWPWFCQFNI